MRRYEHMVLLDGTLEAPDAKEVLNKIVALIEKYGGKVVRTEEWGKRKCAYRIKKQSHAYYDLIWFEGGDARIVEELRRQYRVMEAMLRYLFVRPKKFTAPDKPPAVVGAHPEGAEGGRRRWGGGPGDDRDRRHSDGDDRRRESDGDDRRREPDGDDRRREPDGDDRRREPDGDDRRRESDGDDRRPESVQAPVSDDAGAEG